MLPNYSRLFASFLAGSPTVYFSYRVADSQVVYVSSAYEQVFDAPAAQVNEWLPQWLARVHPDDLGLLREHLAQVRAGHRAEQVEVRVARPDGRTQWLSLAACQE